MRSEIIERQVDAVRGVLAGRFVPSEKGRRHATHTHAHTPLPHVTHGVILADAVALAEHLFGDKLHIVVLHKSVNEKEERYNEAKGLTDKRQ